MRTIYTRKGEPIYVDDEDYEWLNRFTWRTMSNGYVVTSKRDGKKSETIYMHKFIMGYPDHEVDHRDRNKLNNTRDNLRPATRSQNNSNRPTPNNTTSPYRGVYLRSRDKKPIGIVKYNGIRVFEIFEDEVSAANFYNYYASKIMGEFAQLNDVPHMDKEEWESKIARKVGIGHELQFKQQLDNDV